MAKEVEMTGIISHMFNNCPKPNGWFGCFFCPDHAPSTSVKLTGTTNIKLRNNMAFSITAEEIIKPSETEYKIIEMIPIVTDVSDAVAYLAGRDFPGIDSRMATAIWRKFGAKCLDIIQYEPHRLHEVSVLTDENIETLNYVVTKHNITNQLKAIMPWASKRLMMTLIADLKDNVMNMLKADPYILYYKYNAKFLNVEKTAYALKIAPDAAIRIHACMKYEFDKTVDRTKDTFLNLSDTMTWKTFTTNVANYMKHRTVTPTRVSDEIPHAKQLIIVRDNKNRALLYDTAVYDAESCCADTIGELMTLAPFIHRPNRIRDAIAEYEALANTALDDDQKDAVEMALSHRVSVITGGPGRGKTAVVKCILYAWDKLTETPFGSLNAIFAAPTGKAVKRFGEMLSELPFKLSVTRGTVAHFIAAEAGLDENEKTSLHTNCLVVIDETSMLSLVDAGAFLQGLSCSQVVFVGDIDQLPSIAHGQFFKDLCASKVPKTNLTVCHRTDSKIITDNADKINTGHHLNKLKIDPFRFMIYPQTIDDQSYVDDILSIYKQHLAQGTDFNEICVLSPLKNHIAGVNNLNLKLQDILNPARQPSQIKGTSAGLWVAYEQRGSTIPDTRINGINGQYTQLRVGDRVMYTVNDMLAKWIMPNTSGSSNPHCGSGIFNGDTGVIEAYYERNAPNLLAKDKELIPYVRFVTDEGKVYKIEADNFNCFQLAYALTIHKAQGSEYEHVIVSVPVSLSNMPYDTDFASRNLFYTAITRARSTVEIIGSPQSVNKCIDTRVKPRNSNLAERLSLSIANHIFAKPF